MEKIKLAEILKGVAVTRYPDRIITNVVTDSRLAGEGSLFVGIVGDRLDGNSFAKNALERGAAAAVVNRLCDAEGEQIVVKDTKDALIEMAGNYREKFTPKVVAVTGSVGKTTTKEMAAAILSKFGKTLKNEGNKNNEIGLPETLFEMDSSTELAVLEMGMNGLGDIRKLTMAARPRAAAITCIGVSHLELLGSRENILKAKLEIVEGFPDEHGILVINGDDELLMDARGDIPFETVTFAMSNSQSDVVAKDVMTRVQSSEFTIVDRDNGSFKAMIPCSGNHNIMDALAAYTLCTRIGADAERAAAALSDYKPAGMRQKFVDFGGVTVIEDCYNASPDSMRAAIKTLAALPIDGIKVAVLGDMLELGAISREAHRAMGMEAAKSGIDILLCYGENMKLCVDAALASGISSAEHFDDKRSLAEYLIKTVHPGDAVMFKASRAMALEDAIEIFYGGK
ncbi:MAG: UDP-N-acetylmuramoyl-tripeptide--D-alanyl-D-alanine ligase [Oscillospiraceae bacterium]